MPLAPPQGSRISVTMDGSEEVFCIPQVSGNVARYLIGAFLIFGWVRGFPGSLLPCRKCFPGKPMVS
jgi:hypothetical protein